MTSRLRLAGFSLNDTLECGQFFRYTKAMGVYLVQSSDRAFSLWQKGEDLLYEGVDQSFLIDFLRLDDDLDRIRKEIDRDPAVRRAIERYPGLRLIRQDPWECLVSFLCSSAKAIPHIRCILEQLSKACGERIVFGNRIFYSFPEPRCLRDLRQIEPVGAGFRAEYLVKAGQSVDRERLNELKRLPFAEARRRLIELPGVGKKIADCVLLYSLDFLESFPIDTWIAKGLREVYFGGKRVGEKTMEEFVSSHFGPFAGYAQLYLYHYWRNNGRVR
jgi:N-glycosylase/DNA lyase